jgi:hypothetical protein
LFLDALQGTFEKIQLQALPGDEGFELLQFALALGIDLGRTRRLAIGGMFLPMV